MDWSPIDIIKSLLSGSIITTLATIIAKKMDWIRFGKSDDAKIGKIKAETVVELANASAKRISDEVKISDAALQWTVNLASQLEKANALIDKKQAENDRLHGIIDAMKRDFEDAVQKLKQEFKERIRQLEADFEKSKNELIAEREANRNEIKKLKRQIDGNK